ncbi:hypothetical protein V1Y59_18405 [Gordonia sp. PKS22-38]|uniref:Phospholipase D-like domain-containing protein n=1 Tax=Gordonia prachuapensis TaxID=3115651 RepID=A0ABU7MXM7_9ACTN|nr:hypothetical protein [Gordonia sp. PKS22-38]
MTEQFRTFQRRFGESRPGLQLIAVEHAAIPVSVLRADVLAQEKKKLPIAENYTLQFVQRGVDTPKAIASFLGLDTAHIIEAVASQVSENHLRRLSGGRLALTPLGTEIVRNLAASQPVLRQLPISFDRLTWTLADYRESALIKKSEAEKRGMWILPAARSAHIGVDDVSANDFNTLFKDDRIQVLRVRKVSAKKHRYLSVQMLVYADQSRRELELAICIDDELATDHGLALDRIEAVERLGISFGEAEPRPILDDDLESRRSTHCEVDFVDAPAAVREIGAGGEVAAMVRGVSVFEHADLLSEALSTANYRILIIAPWVKNSVVSTEFVSKLERRLRSGVEVTIAHGYGDDDRGSDEYALKRLHNLATRFDNFLFIRVKNTHAKILIFDSCWVTTSFNWLSFRGDSDRTYRMEEGTLVRIPNRVDTEYVRYLSLIRQHEVRESL